MFEDKDDADRYCGLLEAQDFPVPTPELINIDEINSFCDNAEYESRLVEKNFIPKSLEDRLLITPPQKNLEIEKKQENNLDSVDFDLNSVRNNLEKLL